MNNLAAVKGKRQSIRTGTDSLSDRSISDTAYVSLKWVAIITMVVHHVGYLLFANRIIGTNEYAACCTIGRIAFPLFCFLLVECYFHTKDRAKHLLKITLLAIISEVPWDYFYYGKVLNWNIQNVCVTLALGFLMLCSMDMPVGKIIKSIFPKANENGKFVRFFTGVIRFDFCGVFSFMAFVLRTDYSYYGIFLIAFFRLAHIRKHRLSWIICGLISFVLAKYPFDATMLFSLAALAFIVPAIHSKSSKNGTCAERFDFLKHKGFRLIASYFYPAHLVLLCAIHLIISR